MSKLEENYRQTYKAIMLGGRTDPLALAILASDITTAPLRKQVLEQWKADSHAELAELKTRQRALAKKLGQRI